jgi:hypothetical protein
MLMKASIPLIFQDLLTDVIRWSSPGLPASRDCESTAAIRGDMRFRSSCFSVGKNIRKKFSITPLPPARNFSGRVWPKARALKVGENKKL